MIRSFRHKGVETFFRTGRTSGIQVKHAPRLRLQLAQLNVAKAPHDMAAPGWKLHPLKGRLADRWAISISGNWRLTFMFENGDAVLVDYQDYH
ncbi:MAG: type II toxin-antitoxin system RelE/ParE family toxin [Rhodanobacteraceae bacterium]